MPKKLGLLWLVLLIAMGFVPAAGSEFSIQLSPLFVWPIGPAISDDDTDSYFASSIGGEISLGLILGDSWELRGQFALVPLVLKVDGQDNDGLLSSAKAGLGVSRPFVGQSTLVIGGDLGVYKLRYKDTHYAPALCFDLEARIEKKVAHWLALYGGLGYSSFLVDYTTEALLNAVHFKAGLSIFLCRP